MITGLQINSFNFAARYFKIREKNEEKTSRERQINVSPEPTQLKKGSRSGQNPM